MVKYLYFVGPSPVPGNRKVIGIALEELVRDVVACPSLLYISELID